MKLGLLAEVRGGGVRGGFRGPTCYWVSFLMLRKGLKTLKTTILPDNGAQVRRGEGSAEVQPKAQVSHFFEGKKLKKKKQTFF